MNLNYRGVFVIMGLGNKSCKDGLFSYNSLNCKCCSNNFLANAKWVSVSCLASVQENVTSEILSRCKMLLESKRTSRKPSCYRRVYIPDFATTHENVCACYLLKSMRWIVFLRREHKCIVLPCILAGSRTGPHCAHQELEQSHTQSLEKCLPEKGSSLHKNYESVE